MNLSQRSYLIRQEAYRLGFQYCGISKADFLRDEAARLEAWLNKDMHGKMHYMENYFDERLDPRLLVPGAKSVVSFLMNYFPSAMQQDEEAPKISKYAYGKDYHLVIREKLKELLHFIHEHIGEVQGRGFVDSAPVLDKAWAVRGGLGWMGKNANLINRQNGSFFFVAELILDLELEADGPVTDHCGTCRACIDACPTGAIVAPYVVDGSKCISYFTIELKENIPAEMKGKFQNWAFGCDICQDVCPWNRFARPHAEKELQANEKMLAMRKQEWEEITEELFRDLFKNSAVKRARFTGLKRNIEFLKDN